MEKLDKQQAIEFGEKLISAYFDKRDLKNLATLMKNEVSFIGTGFDEVCKNIQEVEISFIDDLKEYSGGFEISNTEIEYLPISCDVAVLYGKLKAVPEDSNLLVEDIRFSAVLESTKEGVKLTHAHLSHPDTMQLQGERFVKKNQNVSLNTALGFIEHQLATLTKNVPGGMHQCALDNDLTLVSMSDSFVSMFGYRRKDIKTIFEEKFINMVYPLDRKYIRQMINENIKTNQETELEYRVICKDGQAMWVLDKFCITTDMDGRKCLYSLLIDITERKAQEEELRLSLEKHKVIIDQATDIIFDWDILNDELAFSPNWVKKFGYSPISENIKTQIQFSKNVHKDDISVLVKIISDIINGAPYAETELRIKNVSGKYYWCRIRVTAQFNSKGKTIKGIGVIVDIDQEKKQKAKLLEQAQVDALTGIFNKAAIKNLTQQAMKSAKTGDIQALLIIDVDYFKSVNDNYGHLCGDAVLVSVAKALKEGVRSTDLVGRIGGDEFLVYMPSVTSEQAVVKKSEKLLRSLHEIIPEMGAPPITCSIGIALCKDGESDYYTMYEQADMALYGRKNNGRAGISLFDNTKKINQKPKDISAVGGDIISQDGYIYNEAIAQYAFRTLYEAKDTAKSIDAMLKIMGRSFDVSRVYIFENSEDGTACSNTFEWCNEGITAQINNLQNIEYVNQIGDYKQNFDKNGVFYCRDIKSTPDNVYQILKAQGIKSMLQCAILDGEKFVGYIGFDECRENKKWTARQVATFQLSSEVLATFLLKMRQKQKLVKIEKEKQAKDSL